MNNSESIGLIVWGLLVGFVGWASVFRLAEPIADWLLFPARKARPIHKGIVRLIVIAFLIFANLLIIALLPLLFVTIGKEAIEYKNFFGVALISSLVGFWLNAFIVRLGR